MRKIPRDLTTPIASSYDPKAVESDWAEWWETQGYFRPSNEARDKFVMVMPPPNVTGSLHLGHTLTNAIQDTLTRWHRMRGHRTLWIPGTDHAGIATQSVVERALAKEGISRHDLGREAFLKKVWEWKEKHGNTIIYQLRRLGISADWQRNAFTLSPQMTRAVESAFIRLFDQGLIYRATRLVSWCPHLNTALSDIEVDTEEIDKPTRLRIPGYEKTVEVGMLWHFKYLVEDAENVFIEVATTRIETMLGDVAVAVNPKDKRYSHLVGKKLRHPFFPDREIYVIADDHVDMEFGTGAVKITPAHDKNDFEIGQRHKLRSITVFTLDGRIASTGGEFAGMHRFDARIAVQNKLEELGLLIGKEPNSKKMQLPRCSRSGDIVEYMLIPQWWMNCTIAAERAVNAVKNGELKIIPEAHNQTWYYWLDNIRDWCISRQLWWGHRIPAYKIVSAEKATDEELWVAAATETEAMEKAIKKLPTGAKILGLQRDEDVLDTWFSSGLFPFSSLGWPDDTPDMQTFFPTTLLETGHDILFFWVARMCMMSLLLLDRLPFKEVLLHSMVRDAHGKKMSKSLGNVVDPIDVIEGITLEKMHEKLKYGNFAEKEIARAQDAQRKDFPKGIPECGADALRYGLLAYTSQGRSINLDINRVVSYRFFCNKLWNATKFALIYFPKDFESRGVPENSQLQWEDRWILHRLHTAARRTNAAFKDYDFGAAVQITYGFFLYDFCDIYLELLKPRFAANPTDKSALETLFICLENSLILLHPMIPFVTEELYQRIPHSPTKGASISLASYPQGMDERIDVSLELEAEILMSIVCQIRSLLAQLAIDPKIKLAGFVIAKEEAATFVRSHVGSITTLAKLATCTLVAAAPPGAVSDVVNNKLAVAIDPAGTVDLSAAVAKLEKKAGVTQKSLDGYLKKTSLANYEEKVPEEVRNANAEKIKSLTEELSAIHRAIEGVKCAIFI